MDCLSPWIRCAARRFTAFFFGAGCCERCFEVRVASACNAKSNRRHGRCAASRSARSSRSSLLRGSDSSSFDVACASQHQIGLAAPRSPPPVRSPEVVLAKLGARRCREIEKRRRSLRSGSTRSESHDPQARARIRSSPMCTTTSARSVRRASSNRSPPQCSRGASIPQGAERPAAR